MIIRAKKNKNYSVINNSLFRDPSVSARAKGIFAYIMTLPDDWKLYKSELANHFKEGRDSIYTAFTELEDLGYIVKEQVRNDKGHFVDTNYLIYEDNQLTENTKSDIQIPDKSPLLSTNKLNTNKLSTKEGFDEKLAFPELFEDFEFCRLWESWHDVQKEKKKPLTKTRMVHQLKLLSKYEVKKRLGMMSNSITSGWSGFFELKDNGSVTNESGEKVFEEILEGIRNGTPLKPFIDNQIISPRELQQLREVNTKSKDYFTLKKTIISRS